MYKRIKKYIEIVPIYFFIILYYGDIMYKICVYAICKNESKFINRWLDSVKEADYICVLDTGSTDNSVELLKENGVIVESRIINPWRFDVARNESIKLIPSDTDICVCVDIDEVLKKGWRLELEKIWDNTITRVRYIYNWSLDEYDRPIVSFYADKIHKLKGYKWINPVHEVLKYDEEEKFITCDNIVINHYPDNTKSRSSYLSLLELSVKENPLNDRNMHYLGREYMYYQKYNEAIDTLIKHTKMENATWKDEKSASMRFIARCYQSLNRYDEAYMWLEKAINEAPYLRDPYVEYAILAYKLNDFDKVIEMCNKALEIPINNKTYINEPFTFDETTYDLLSLAYYNKNDINRSLECIDKAIEINPYNDRLIKNKEIISNK